LVHCYVKPVKTPYVMSQFSIAVIVGSLRRDSFNAQLARAIAKLTPADFSFKQIAIGDLPLYNQDDQEVPPLR
jgi:chromate reductase